MPIARERLHILDQRIEHARRAIDERHSLVRLMEQQGEDNEEANPLFPAISRGARAPNREPPKVVLAYQNSKQHHQEHRGPFRPPNVIRQRRREQGR